MTQQKVNDQVQACFRIEESQDALACLKATVVEAKASDADCKPRLVLMTQAGCDVCKEEVGHQSQDIQAGTIEVVNVASERGRRIVELNDIEGVPALLILDCEDRIIEELPAPA